MPMPKSMIPFMIGAVDFAIHLDVHRAVRALDAEGQFDLLSL